MTKKWLNVAIILVFSGLMLVLSFIGGLLLFEYGGNLGVLWGTLVLFAPLSILDMILVNKGIIGQTKHQD
ncbi:MAG: hypothetical protein AAF512_07205 [Pseudomonadota bacterium]